MIYKHINDQRALETPKKFVLYIFIITIFYNGLNIFITRERMNSLCMFIIHETNPYWYVILRIFQKYIDNIIL